MATAAELDRIAHEIVGSGIAVHSKVGSGCFESTYSPCFGCELRKRGLAYQTKVAIALQYEDITIRRAYEADFIVEGCVVLELKAIAAIGRLEERQLLTYLKVGGFPLGYILNFGAPKLIDGIMRRVNNFPHGTAPFAGNSVERGRVTG
jgi:GxxExxY protein